MLENRRKCSRVPMKAQVTCIIDSRTMRGVSWNLGEGGMQVEASGLQPKEAVQLSFRLPASGLAVDAVGVVIWGDEKRHGIQFTYAISQTARKHEEMIADQIGTLHFATGKSGCPTVVDAGHHPYCSQIKKAAEVCLVRPRRRRTAWSHSWLSLIANCLQSSPTSTSTATLSIDSL